MLFWWSAAQVAAKVDRLRIAEKRLLEFARRFGDNDTKAYQIEVIDTAIPRSVVVPLTTHDTDYLQQDSTSYLIHGIHVTSDDKASSQTAPLVLLHGYMNGAAYFYRNLVGLSRHFSSVYSLDLLGWGLSSRPKFSVSSSRDGASSSSSSSSQQETLLRDDDSSQMVRAAEDVFVESLEAWRQVRGIPKMILCGHSMGGYLSVAYAERYPQHVERLILLSPVGVPNESSPDRQERLQRMRQQSWRFRAISSIWLRLYQWQVTVGDVLRCLPDRQTYQWTAHYVRQRLPALVDQPDEQDALTDYLHLNNTLPGSGERCVHYLLTPFAMGRQPIEERIPQLQVPAVSFLYGSNDWMEISGGQKVQARCERRRVPNTCPGVDVYQVSQAGHLLMLDNWRQVNVGVVLAAGGKLDDTTTTALRPQKLSPLGQGDCDSSSVAPPDEETSNRGAEIQVTA